MVFDKILLHTFRLANILSKTNDEKVQAEAVVINELEDRSGKRAGVVVKLASKNATAVQEKRVAVKERQQPKSAIQEQDSNNTNLRRLWEQEILKVILHVSSCYIQYSERAMTNSYE